jgi:hypothetical protein
MHFFLDFKSLRLFNTQLVRFKTIVAGLRVPGFVGMRNIETRKLLSATTTPQQCPPQRHRPEPKIQKFRSSSYMSVMAYFLHTFIYFGQETTTETAGKRRRMCGSTARHGGLSNRRRDGVFLSGSRGATGCTGKVTRVGYREDVCC